ncbi:MAG: VTT domain-containing protein [Candidatus Aenigmatarchaeota archaeon]
MVLEAIIAIFIKYGLAGLLFSSFISSLVFIPGYASFLIPVYVKLNFNPWLILFVITAGAIVGETINYYLGYFGSKYVLHKEIKKAERWLNKWGEMSVFIVNLIPIFPADFVNILVGFLRMDVKMYVIGMSLGKLIQYSVLIFGAEIFFRYVSFL